MFFVMLIALISKFYSKFLQHQSQVFSLWDGGRLNTRSQANGVKDATEAWGATEAGNAESENAEAEDTEADNTKTENIEAGNTESEYTEVENTEAE